MRRIHVDKSSVRFVNTLYSYKPGPSIWKCLISNKEEKTRMRSLKSVSLGTFSEKNIKHNQKVFWFWGVTFWNWSSMRKEKWIHLQRLNAFQNLAAWKENCFIYKRITLQIVFFLVGKLLMTKTSINSHFYFIWTDCYHFRVSVKLISFSLQIRADQSIG